MASVIRQSTDERTSCHGGERRLHRRAGDAKGARVGEPLKDLLHDR
jgi:hypothetical protein